MIQKAYDDYAPTYDQLVIDTQYTVPSWLEREFPDSLRVGKFSCLDLACGSGVIGVHVRKINPATVLYGVDLSPNMIQQAAKKQIYQELFVHNIEAGLAKLAVPRVKLITAFAFFEFIRDLNQTLQEIADQLEAGGVLLASFQAYNPEGGSKSRTYQNNLGFDHTTYTPSEVENMLSSAGLALEKLEPVVGYVTPSTGHRCPYLLAKATKKALSPK